MILSDVEQLRSRRGTDFAVGRIPLMGRRHGRRHAAFSLIEVLVALSLVILLAALVLPAMRGFSDAAVFRETCDQFSSAVSVCRSEAQRRGTTMELVTRLGSDGRVSLVGRAAHTEEAKSDQTAWGQVLMILPQGYSVDHDSGLAPGPDSAVSPEVDAPADATK